MMLFIILQGKIVKLGKGIHETWIPKSFIHWEVQIIIGWAIHGTVRGTTKSHAVAWWRWDLFGQWQWYFMTVSCSRLCADDFCLIFTIFKNNFMPSLSKKTFTVLMKMVSTHNDALYYSARNTAESPNKLGIRQKQIMM